MKVLPLLDFLKLGLPALYECLKALILSKITLSSVLKLYQRNVATFHTSDTHFSLFSLSYSWLLQLPWRTSRRPRSRETWTTPHWLILSSQNSTVVSPLLPTADPRLRIGLHPSTLHCNSWCVLQIWSPHSTLQQLISGSDLADHWCLSEHNALELD